MRTILRKPICQHGAPFSTLGASRGQRPRTIATLEDRNLAPVAEWNGLVVQLHARDRQELAHLLTRATRCRSAGGGDAREREWVNPDIVDLSVGSRHPCRLELRLPGNELFRARVVRVVGWRLAESGNCRVNKRRVPGCG